MSESVVNYKCPNCGGPLHFDSKSQKLVCDHCGSSFSPDTFKEKESPTQTDTEIHTTAPDTFNKDEIQHLKAYTCPSCGAQIMCDENTAATSCPYCDNPTLIPSQFAGSLRPSSVLPFQLNKKDAEDKLAAFYKGKPFLPKAFRNDNHIEDIKGVYVPFWLYNGTVAIQAAYEATRTRVFVQGDDQITETSHFHLDREGTMKFSRVPADASSKMPDEFMDALEPYDFQQLRPFEMSYMAGYLADRYDVDENKDFPRAKTRMEHSTCRACQESCIGYETCIPIHENTQAARTGTDYVFLPVWLLATRYHGRPYLFAMNGQNGRMVSDDLPLDWTKGL
ncbi:MAG: hypothetical protein PUF17_11140 [Lactimicrobium massiliense]|nr:Trm112 family protein [Lactimicrobium massiliense]MDD6561499.1 hypothetical protein [Lactimicrobium massiliense]